MILYYNEKGIGDVLIAYFKEGENQDFERRADVARIFDPVTNEVLGYNFFSASLFLQADKREGIIKPNATLMDVLNRQIAASGFRDSIPWGEEPLIVTGYVEEMKKHPDSDHMHVCLVDVGTRKLQIVCGAPNIDKGQKVVVAKTGALMPNGMIIRPSVLRGVASAGMICSARELAIPGAPQKRGILVLKEDTAIGRDFQTLAANVQVPGSN